MTVDEFSDTEWVEHQNGHIERLEAALREVTAERDALREEMERINGIYSQRVKDDAREVEALRLEAQEAPRLQALVAQLTRQRDEAEARVWGVAISDESLDRLDRELEMRRLDFYVSREPEELVAEVRGLKARVAELERDKMQRK